MPPYKGGTVPIEPHRNMSQFILGSDYTGNLDAVQVGIAPTSGVFQTPANTVSATVPDKRG